jgi:CheY-like chemotaxis protein
MSFSVLLLEDVVVVREVLAEELRSVGFTVHEAGTGAQALELDRLHGPFRIVVADVFLPDAVAPDVVEVLEAHGTKHVLLMTAYVREARALRQLELPRHWHFVEKPVLPGKLLSEMFDLLTPPSLQDASPVAAPP